MLLVPAPSAAADDPVVVARHGNSVRGEIDGVSFLVLRGSHEEQGEAHGVLVAEDILRLLNETLIAEVEKRPGTWDNAIIPMTRNFDFPPPYTVEIDAILRGIRMSLPDSSDRQLSRLGREVTIDDLRALSCVGDIMSSSYNVGDEGCSSFSAWGPLTSDGRLIAGRNLDYRTFPGEIPMLLVGRESPESDRLATLDIGGPGYVGANTTMNAEGIVLMMHDEHGLPMEKAVGYTPRPLVNRDAIERLRLGQTPVEIAGLFSQRKVITGNNSHLVFPTRNNGPMACVVEWDGNPQDQGATLRLPGTGSLETSMFCTNHYLQRRGPSETGGNSHERLNSLRVAVGKAQADGDVIEIEDAKRMMHAVARRGGSVTYLTAIAFPDERRVVFATTPATGVPATEGRFVEILWDEIFSAR